MSTTVYQFTVTTPANTPKASPQTTGLTLPACEVVQIDLRIPPGPKGALGFVLAANGTPIVPTSADQWMVLDNESPSFPLTEAITSGAWQLISYNTGVYDHSIQIRFQTDPIATQPSVNPSTMTVVSALSGTVAP